MKSLRWLGPLLDCSGYASAARGYLRACETAGIKIQAKDRSRSVNLKNKGMDDNIIEMCSRLASVEIPATAPTVQHQVADTFYRNEKTEYSIGYTIFEMTSAPKDWVPYCHMMDVLWTGSKYSRQAFLNAGVKIPVHVLPHALDLDRFNPAAEPWPIENKRGFAFVSVFDFTDRKGWRDLLRAYWQAFGPDDDVCLILKVFFGSFDDGARKDIIRRIAVYKSELGLDKTAPLLVYGHDVPMSQMPGLYRAANCYVGVSREGFGLPYAEAMACGLACIGPEVGGTREYMTEENSFLVKYVGDEPISHDMTLMNPSFAGLKWAKHSWEDLALQMKSVVFDEQLRLAKATAGLAAVRKNLSYEAVGKRIWELLPV